jgi:ribosomal protein S18 acetylase RimI-like enzyme
VVAIASVVNAAFTVETFLDGTRTNDQSLKELMEKGSFLVAENSADRIIASVYVELHGERGYFGMLAVDPETQGIGLGRLMTEAAEQYCRNRGCREIEIKVLSLRTELPPFYQKLGYVETGIEEFHPSRPLKTDKRCHCILMSKPL